MSGSFRFGRIAGIDVQVHWTFFLLLLWVAASPLMGGAAFATAAANVMLVVAVFACVLAHEFGHALAARHYGIGTRDITLLPIGGVARLREIPAEPMKELVVAIAGPAVNVVIATFLGLSLFVYGKPLIGDPISYGDGINGVEFAQNLMYINVFLVLFNAIPAFPMDGGRVFRAFLAMRMSRVRATDIAAALGQTIAVGFGLLGLFGNPLLILIAVFIYFGARGEAQHVRYSTLVGDLPVRAAMIARVLSVHAGEPLENVRDKLLEGMQQDFPVFDDAQRLVGMLYRSDAISAIRAGDADLHMAEIMVPIEDVVVSPSDSLRDAMQRLQERGVASLPVAVDGRLVGLLTQENIWELLMFREDDPDFGALASQEQDALSGMRIQR